MKIRKIKRPKIRIRRPRVRIRWRKKNSKWVIGTVMFFFMVLFSFQLVLMNYAKSILQNILNLQFEQVSGGKYFSSFDDIEISYTDKSLIIRNLLFVPKEKKNPNTLSSSAFSDVGLYTIFIPEVKINDINLRKAYLQNFLDIGSLELLRPEIKIKADFDVASNEGGELLKKDLYKLLPSAIEEFRIRTVRIKDGVMHVEARKNSEENTITIAPFQLELNNFHLSEKNSLQNGQIFFTDDFFLEADSIGGFLANNKYRIEMEALKVSSSDSSAFARNIQVIPIQETKDFLKDSKISNIYRIDFPQVYIYGLSLIDLFHTKDLIAGEVTILSPGFELINLKPLSPGQKENFKLENLYPVIDKVLHSIQFESLYLRNGRVKISEYKSGLQEKLVSDIQLANIKNFYLDANANQNEEKLLYSDQINFKLENYSLRLSDELHLLQAQNLFFSSEKSEIIAQGFKVIPDTNLLKTIDPKITYSANASSIKILGVDMLNAYNNNILDIDSLNVSQPTLKLVSQKEKEVSPTPLKGSGFHEEDLYALIENYLYSLNIEKISLQKGSLNIRNKNRQREGAFITQIKKADLWKFRLDSTSAYKMNKLFYANDFELEIENYDHELPDGLHRITANEIGISTLKDQIHIADLKIFAGENKYPYPNLHITKAKTLINLEVPLLELKGVDILKAYLHKRLEVESVHIPSPSIQLGTLLGKKESGRTDLIKSAAIYDLMKDFLEVIQVENLLLKNGQLDLAFYAKNNPLVISGRRTDIQVNNFRFDSLTSTNPKRLFFADQVEVKVEDYSTHLPDGIHIIRSKNFYASTEKQEILAEDVVVQTLKDSYTEDELLNGFGQNGYMNLLLPKVHLTGINFDQAYYKEYLKIDSVLAFKPEVKYTYLVNKKRTPKKEKRNIQKPNFYTALSPFLESLEITSLILKSGKFSAIQQEDGKYLESTLLEEINLEMNNYLVDSVSTYDTERFLFAEDIRINIQSYHQELLDKIHTISARNLELSTDLQHLKAEDIWLKPDSKNLQQFNNLISTSLKNRYNIHLPELQINGIGFDEVYRNGNLKIKELLLNKPDIQIRHYALEEKGPKGIKKKSLDTYDFYELIKGNLQSLEIKEAKILNGQGEYTQTSKSSVPLHIAADHFDAQILEIKMGNKQENEGKVLYADDVRISLNGFERKLSDSLHILRVEELNVSTLRNEIEAIGASLIPRNDKGLLKKMEEKGIGQVFHVKVPKTKFSGINIEHLQKDSLFLQNVLFKNAVVDLYRYPHFLKREGKEDATNQSWSKQLLNSLKLIFSDSITIEEASLSLTTINEKQDSSTFSIPHVNGLISNFKFDSLNAKDPEKFLFSDRMQIQVKDYNSKLGDDLYGLKIKEVRFDTKGGILVADSISVTPMVDRNTFAKTKGHETDQFTFRNRQLKVTNLDYKALMDDEILADSLLLNGFSLHIYRDKRQPYPENYFPKMPQDIIRNLETKLNIKGIALRNGYIGYEEQAQGAREPGFIDLTKVKIVGDTITNDSTLLAQGLTTNLELESLLMGKGHLQASFEIPLGDTLNRHRFYGRLDEMNLEEFNPILEKTVFIKIRNGHAEKISFFVEADRHVAIGSMDFEYSGLKVALVNKRTGKTGGPIKELGSLLANLLVVNTNNLVEEQKKPFNKGEIVFERNETKSTVNYWIKTLVTGFKSSIGL